MCGICLCAPLTPASEDGRSFLDDDGCSTVQDEGRRVCDIAATRVYKSVFFLVTVLYHPAQDTRAKPRCTEMFETDYELGLEYSPKVT
ncbi:hypothetical protein STEG23_017335 [Scotinomys teguina]